MQTERLFVIAMLLCIACIVPASADVAVPTELTVGDEYLLQPAFTFTDSTGFYAEITYDPEFFTYESIVINDLAMSDFVNTDTAGVVKVLYVGGDGLDNPFDLTFTAAKHGETTIVVSGEYADAQFMPQPYESQTYGFTIAPVYIRGDFNDDGVVDMTDFMMGLDNYWWPNQYNEELDFNENEILDVGDIMKFFHDNNVA